MRRAGLRPGEAVAPRIAFEERALARQAVAQDLEEGAHAGGPPQIRVRDDPELGRATSPVTLASPGRHHGRRARRRRPGPQWSPSATALVASGRRVVSHDRDCRPYDDPRTIAARANSSIPRPDRVPRGYAPAARVSRSPGRSACEPLVPPSAQGSKRDRSRRRACYSRNFGRFQLKPDAFPRDIAPQPGPPTLLQRPAGHATRAAPADGNGMRRSQPPRADGRNARREEVRCGDGNGGGDRQGRMLVAR
jgi:hypothetical protein